MRKHIKNLYTSFATTLLRHIKATMKIFILFSVITVVWGRECGRNERYTTCGTACPLTCSNYRNPPKICTLQCIIGCECQPGFVLTSDRKCVRPSECVRDARPIEKNCDDKPDPGLCMGYFPMYYYDAESGSCRQFIYGGCAGNGNRYKTEQECVNNCQGIVVKESTPSDCELPAEQGVCRGYFPRYYYDVQTGKCDQFIYGGCGGNENNFLTLEDCQNTCAPKSAPAACQEEKVIGPCMAAFRRFFFNKQTGKCEEFIYGGCRGNSNNFKTQEDCEAVCAA